MRRLCIGVINLTFGWESLLDQLGVWYEEVNPECTLINEYSVLILNESGSISKESIDTFLVAGGAILEAPDVRLYFEPSDITTRKVGTLINENRSSPFERIPFIDINREVQLHNSKTHFRGLIEFKQVANGTACFLGFQPDELLLDARWARKRFFYKGNTNPDEIVSKVSKKEITDLLSSALKELHYLQGLPFINKWTSPTEKPVFAFRIDSDYGDKESIEAVYKLAQKHQVPMTWFLHVEAHEGWLDYFTEFENQEIALHGYEHGTSNSYENVFHNIETGLQLLRDEGFNPTGFCAPYGIWNNTLKEVLCRHEFIYTSEFTTGYDALPYSLDFELPLQIPIHPICTGSLSRKRVPGSEMVTYFEQVLSNKISSFEPVIFYHHPLQKGLEVWDQIFEKATQSELTKLTFGQYADFWKQRSESNFEAHFDSVSGTLKVNSNSDIFAQASKNHKGFSLIKLSETDINLESLSTYEYGESYLPSKEEIEEMRGNKLSLLKTSFLDWKNRKRL